MQNYRSGKLSPVNQHDFARIPRAEIPRSAFDRSFTYKTTFDAGLLIPFFIQEALPADTMHLSMDGFVRLATPIFPIMDNMHLQTHFWFVPNRLVWPNWEKMMGAQDNPGDSTDFLVPQITAPAGTGYLNESIYDYCGIPTGISELSHSALPLRGINLIRNEWYRDQNLQTSLPENIDDGPDLNTDYTLFRIGKVHDYFTSSLPFPQKGPGVDIPIGDIQSDGDFVFTNGTDSSALFMNNGLNTAFWDVLPTVADTTEYESGLVVGSTSINTLREAFQIQKMFERDARGGTRYTEVINAHFNVISPDQRLQRPEYLGGGHTPVLVEPVANTAELASVGGEGNVGDLSGVGTGFAHNHGFTKSFVEHGYVIGFVSVRADITYQQGLDRHWSRRDRFDYPWPALAHLGEQAVLNKEIFAQGPSVTNPDGSLVDDDAFGYQERFAECRYSPSKITGRFRSNDPQSLDPWHLSQDFLNLPTLDDAFIQENPPVDRCIAVPSEPHFIGDFKFKFNHVRPLPVYGVPGFIDRF